MRVAPHDPSLTSSAPRYSHVLRLVGAGLLVFLGVVAVVKVTNGSQDAVNLLASAVKGEPSKAESEVQHKTSPGSSLKSAKPGAAAQSMSTQVEKLSQKIKTIKSKNQKLSQVQMADLYREIQELEKQERRRVAARKEAIEKALDATSKCDDADWGCKKAHEQLKWKASKDKYERAAMTEIAKEDHARENTSEDSETEFAADEKKASELSSVKPLQTLQQRSQQAESARSAKEKAMMSILTKERHELEKLDQEEKKERELQAAKKQKIVDQKMDKQLQDDVRSTIYSSRLQPTLQEDVLARRSSINDAVSSNRKDLEEAEAIEQGRRKAFDDHVKQLRDEVEKSREAREKELKGKGKESPTAKMSQYDRDVFNAEQSERAKVQLERSEREKTLKNHELLAKREQEVANEKVSQALKDADDATEFIPNVKRMRSASAAPR
ncbi:hypothetical protein GUITHDRAFT_135391 [Guillardia theta CCMP2712]|uniref:Uncharacterized protein n=1 Tax=Guillardia theta (strain CCMP2712) TaxID=905079 RepID=L1JQ68_GUITC|nr:hypothetical protein GUITHDRAFT_135391 [Guillardia theta CCMP2712]EKX50223.1 hypothetical protein GUITHDRAFT_135391 [Guillardia theta CCMP2712]|eukprot:XP_005837203.1 hypothetical protein GUITHDRAFT_135391 [Guillardia theta CCMP2712]